MGITPQQLRGYSATQAGLALLPEAALLTVASGLSGRLMAAAGPRLPMLAGLLLGAAGLRAGLVIAAAAFLAGAAATFLGIGRPGRRGGEDAIR